MKNYIYCPFYGAPLATGFTKEKKRKYCPKCDFIRYENPLPVALAIAIRDKKILLIKRGIAPRKGKWASPAGFIETGETSEEACLRELKEETGRSGKIKKLIGVVRQEDKEIYGDMLVVEYLVEVEKGELNPGKEAEQAKFFKIADLPNYYVNRFKKVIERIQTGILPCHCEGRSDKATSRETGTKK